MFCLDVIFVHKDEMIENSDKAYLNVSRNDVRFLCLTVLPANVICVGFLSSLADNVASLKYPVNIHEHKEYFYKLQSIII